jgi:poly-gamma-glutamate synthesis protein (capsule biosynthesis protein)
VTLVGRVTALLALLALSACVPNNAPATVQKPSPELSSAPAPPVPSPSPTPPPMSLRDLYHPTFPLPNDPSHYRTLIATGDVIPARGVNWQASRKGDYLWPYRPTADFVKNADITYINLEAPLFAGCPVQTEGFTFCGDARHIDGLKLIGAKVANLANNHLGNYGTEGTNATIDLLEKNGIKASGLGRIAVIEVRGLKFAFIGFNGVGVVIDRRALKDGIEQARQQADVVVVQFHWGKEYERQPMADPGVPTPDSPVEIGHLSIDWGADIVIGNHPHWYQGIEVYKDHLITYAHGNYLFDQMWSEETREGVIGTYTFYEKRLVATSWKPLRIFDYGQAQWMNDEDAAKVLKIMEEASQELARKLGEPV